MVLKLLYIVFISISYESRSSVASQPCQRMKASLKPAEAEMEFVTHVTHGGGVKFLPAV